ncbi:hypothetical protein ACP275_10G024100 [Erythranthe tilingii]
MVSFFLRTLTASRIAADRRRRAQGRPILLLNRRLRAQGRPIPISNRRDRSPPPDDRLPPPDDRLPPSDDRSRPPDDRRRSPSPEDRSASKSPDHQRGSPHSSSDSLPTSTSSDSPPPSPPHPDPLFYLFQRTLREETYRIERTRDYQTSPYRSARQVRNRFFEETECDRRLTSHATELCDRPFITVFAETDLNYLMVLRQRFGFRGGVRVDPFYHTNWRRALRLRNKFFAAGFNVVIDD